jgi:alcohol dehydrogenase
VRAVMYGEFGGAVTVEQVALPACPAHGAVIRVGATGLCRSDWHGWMGHDEIALPHVPGHEFAGVVVEVGAEVRQWSPGAEVTVPFVTACGSCDTCSRGDQQVCERQTQPGFSQWGSFAEYVAVDHADVNIVALPPGMTMITAASLGCRFATAYRAVREHGRPRPGDQVTVFGCGGVGLSAVMIAAAAGARVVAVDVSAAARVAASALGATVTIDPVDTDGDLAGAVVAATDGGAHVAVEALGDAALAAASVASLRRRGRHVQVGLLVAEQASTALPMALVVARELEIYGSHGMAAHEYPAMLAEVARGALRPDRLVGAVIGLDDVPAALTAMSRPNAAASGMTVIEP